MLVKLFKYAFVGGFSASIHLLVASMYIFYINDSLVISNICGFLIAYIFSYTVQSIIVFKHKLQLSKAIKYFIIQLISLLIALAISDYSVEYNNYIKTIAIILIIPIITFLIHNFWTFKEQE